MESRRKRTRNPSQSSEDGEVVPSSQTNETSKVRAGHILKMTLKNFMCHSHLEVKFDGNIIFLTGNNGSGKSAILAALTLGLGLKARSTNRGDISSIKSFVKFGTNSASIEIVLSNIGHLAYKPEVFGSSISVQRSITASGTSSYKIKDENGKVISKMSKDLTELLDELNIQVDNPICLLSQDMARQFLNSNDPTVKYKLYYRATRLEKLEQLYVDAVNKKKRATALFSTKKQEESALKQKVSQLEKKIEAAEEAEQLKANLKKLKAELAWAEAIVVEGDCEKQSKLVDKLKSQCENLESQCLEKIDGLKDLELQKKGLQQKMGEFSSQRANSQVPLNEMRSQVEELDEKIRNTQSSLNKIESQLKYRKEDLNSANKMISNFLDSQKSLEERNQKRTADIAALKKEEKEAENILGTYYDEVNKMTSHINDSENKIRDLEHELRAVVNKIGRLNDRLSTLNQENNPLALYGQQIMRLVSAIKQDAQNFSTPPLGPLGSYITIKDKKWTVAVESFIGADILKAFLVNNWADKQRLDKLIDQIFNNSGVRPPTIITTQFINSLHDISRNIVEKRSGCERFFDALKVENTVVMNCLIDQTKLEHLLLVENKDAALDMMSDRRKVPRNCHMACTITGDSIYPDPDYRFYAGRLKHPKFIQVDCSEANRECSRELKIATEQQSKLQAQMPQMRESLRQRNAELVKMKQKFAACKTKVPEIHRKIAELENNIEYATNIDDLKKEAADLQEIITKKKDEANVLRCTLKELQEEKDELMHKLDGEKQASQQLNSTREKLRQQIKELQSEIENVTNEKTRFEKRIEEARNSLSDSQQTLEEALNKWNSLSETTQSQVGERPKKIRKATDVQEEIRRIERQINEANSQDLKQARLNLRDHMAKINKYVKVMANLKKNLKDLDELKAGRRAKLYESKAYVKDFSTYNFKNFLKCRNYKGGMTIDYEKETLEMVVIPHTGAKGVTPTSNLSGGERSFSTVAFLYALWKTLDFPFYFLDEFDVFMDPQNRNMVIKILIDHAKRNDDVQYVFLTPQDISFIKDDRVTIHKMEDPERGQRN